VATHLYLHRQDREDGFQVTRQERELHLQLKGEAYKLGRTLTLS
jgi:hypothetical protein